VTRGPHSRGNPQPFEGENPARRVSHRRRLIIIDYPRPSPILDIFIFFNTLWTFSQVLNLGQPSGDPLALFFRGTMLHVPSPGSQWPRGGDQKWQPQVRRIRLIDNYPIANSRNCCKGLGSSFVARRSSRSLILTNPRPSLLHGRRACPAALGRLNPASLIEPAQRPKGARLGVSRLDSVVRRRVWRPV